MIPRQQTAGLSGIVAGIALAVLTVLFFTSGATPETFRDPGKALPFLTQNLGRIRTIALVSMVTLGFAVPFVAGLAAALRERTPTRATAVLYFGLLGIAGHGIGTLLFWSAVPALARHAATDQVAASHAWVALNAVWGAMDGVGNFFIGLAILLAGWAVAASGIFSAALGWYGVIAGALVVLAVLAPGVGVLYMATFVLPVIWLLWAGNTLRQAAS
ncbi:MAG: DUF4386 family protein [Armatimonadota bacterium]|nr:DUF4386 family protein [Armatimonadota bacterium]MDR7486348.1 DUF4386 family protein [Armatimonadota bacterium]MDR7534225.1 DUF4386 family protein [Armatimonadota bacterium]MDR7536759.1 DUF4386 family protein [Armatimonadota bacterium]